VEHASPTRMNLLARRAQIELAQQGRDLLTDKRNALIKELQKLAEQVMVRSDALDEAAADARLALAEAEAYDGPEAVRSAALATRKGIQVEARVANIMGVQVPELAAPPVSRRLDERGYALTASTPRIDAVADRFENVVGLMLTLSSQEIRLQRLAQEVRSTTRRMNALEHVLLPRLRAEKDYIQMMLEERERENIFRFKRLQQSRLERSTEGD